MREYLKDEDIVTPAFLELINMWWLLVNSKERFHPHHFGNAISPNTLTDKRISSGNEQLVINLETFKKTLSN